MKASRFSEAQRAFILKQGADGMPVTNICRKAGISQATYFNWKKKYDGLLPHEMRRLKRLEDENNKLRKVGADLSLEQDALRRKLLPLSPQMVAILKGLPRLGDFSVFAGQKLGRPLSNMAMLGVLKDMNCDESGKPRWVDPKSGHPITPRGLRATFRTWGEDAGFARDLLEELLGHPIGTAVERAYRRTDSFDRRRKIMETWANFCSRKPVGRRGVHSASRHKP